MISISPEALQLNRAFNIGFLHPFITAARKNDGGISTHREIETIPVATSIRISDIPSRKCFQLPRFPRSVRSMRAAMRVAARLSLRLEGQSRNLSDFMISNIPGLLAMDYEL
jgi:hypothetical protein